MTSFTVPLQKLPKVLDERTNLFPRKCGLFALDLVVQFKSRGRSSAMWVRQECAGKVFTLSAVVELLFLGATLIANCT